MLFSMPIPLFFISTFNSFERGVLASILTLTSFQPCEKHSKMHINYGRTLHSFPIFHMFQGCQPSEQTGPRIGNWKMNFYLQAKAQAFTWYRSNSGDRDYRLLTTPTGQSSLRTCLQLGTPTVLTPVSIIALRKALYFFLSLYYNQMHFKTDRSRDIKTKRMIPSRTKIMTNYMFANSWICI